MPNLVLSRRRLPLPLAAATAVTLGVTGVAACSGGVTVVSTSAAPVATSGPGAPATVPTPSATLAGRAGTAGAPPITGTAVPGTDLAERIRSAIAGARTVTITMQNSAGGGTAVVDLAHKAFRLETGGAQTVTLVHIGSQTWVKGAGSVTTTSTPAPGATSTRLSPTTRRWLSLRADGSDVLSRKLGPAADVESYLRPDAFTAMLDGAMGDQSPTEGGTRTTFYVPADAYVAAVRGGPALTAAITEPVVLVVELDDKSRPTRLTATLKSDEATMVDDTRYRDWDGDVTIEQPDPAQVAPAPLPGDTGATTGTPAPTSTRTGRSRAISTPSPTPTGSGATSTTSEPTD